MIRSLVPADIIFWSTSEARNEHEENAISRRNIGTNVHEDQPGVGDKPSFAAF